MKNVLVTIKLTEETHTTLLKTMGLGIHRATFLLGIIHHAYMSVRPEVLHADLIQLLPLSSVQGTSIDKHSARVYLIADDDVLEELFKISNEDFYVQEL